MLIVLAIAVVTLCALRIYTILPAGRKQTWAQPKAGRPSTLAVFLGSGGHTNEALRLISALDFSRYSRRIYITSDGDDLSAQQAIALESSKASQSKPGTGTSAYTILSIPRARHVHQPLITTPRTFCRSLWFAIYHVTIAPILSSGDPRTLFADALVLNGPGTCLVLCVAVYLNKFIGLPAPRLLYIESFARVRALSLSGKLLRPFVDRFIVQWPQALEDRSRGECYGWLV